MKPDSVVSEFQKQVKTLILSAFGFVTALAWNDAIKAIFDAYVPTGSEWPYMLLNALIITFTVVIITMLLSRKKQ